MPNKQIFLISPPGSLEAKDMGYINIPKISKEPPEELKEKGIYDFTDDTDFLESPPESNFWVSIDHLRKKVESSKVITPIIPRMFKYSIPWILCEYGLHLTEAAGDKEGLQFFAKNVIHSRFAYKGWPEIAMVLSMRTRYWREADENPIYYLRTVIKRGAYKAVLNEPYEKSESMFKKPEVLSFEQPVITGDIIRAVTGDTENNDEGSIDRDLIAEYIDRGEKLLLEDGEAITEGYEMMDEGPEEHKLLGKGSKGLALSDTIRDKNPQADEIVNRMRDMIKACESAKLSPGATKILIYSIENQTDLKGSSDDHGLSKKEYDAARQEIYRKTPELRKKLSGYRPIKKK